MTTRVLMSLIFTVWFGTVAAADPANDRIRARMAALFPDDPVTSISQAEVGGLYEVMLGSSVFYMSGDARYAIRGDLIDLDKKVNISDQRRAQARKKIFAEMNQDELIGFLPASGKLRETLYVYTDMNCAYCRKMHKDVDELNAAGIGVKYLAFPIIGEDALDKANAVWCSEDRQSALTAAKAGKKVSAPACENPVAAQFKLGQSMGVKGTPAVFTAEGTQLGGYNPVETLIKLVD